MLWDYGLQPQRTALRIYWNALKLIRRCALRAESCLDLGKGVRFRSHPQPNFKEAWETSKEDVLWFKV